jgi:hypothetical protein
LQLRRPLDKALYEGADVIGEKVALRIHDGDVVFGFHDAGEHVHERAALDLICDQEPRKQCNAHPPNGSFAEEAEVV